MFFEKIMRKIYMKRLIKNGLDVGKNLNMEKGVNIDASFPWLIHIGDDCDLAAWTYILAHDASPKHYTGKTKVGNVYLEDNVFIGAKTIILPNVRIGKNAIIGSNSVVSKDVPPNVVAVGSPAVPIMTVDEFVKHHKERIASGKNPVYDSKWTIKGGISKEMKRKMVEELGNKGGYID